MNKAITIILAAAVTAAAGCAAPRASLFPEPFENVRLGLSERAFETAFPAAVSDGKKPNGTAWWKTGETNRFEEADFQFAAAGGNSGGALSFAMLHYQSGTPFREVLTEAEVRLGTPLAVRTTLFNGELCFQRTWLFGQSEATLLFWPGASGTALQWRIAGGPGASTPHDGFLPALPDAAATGAWAGFRVVDGGMTVFDPDGDLSAEESRRLFAALEGWNAFDRADLESGAGKPGCPDDAPSGYWLVEVEPSSPCFAIGADASWVANLGADGVARIIPESRRPIVLGVFATLTKSQPR